LLDHKEYVDNHRGKSRLSGGKGITEHRFLGTELRTGASEKWKQNSTRGMGKDRDQKRGIIKKCAVD